MNGVAEMAQNNKLGFPSFFPTPLSFFISNCFFASANVLTLYNLLRLNADKGQGIIKTTNSSATQNIIAGNRNRMKYSRCHCSINE